MSKQIECCDKPRGFVGGACDYCGKIVQPEPEAHTLNDPKGAAGALKTPLGLIPPYAMEQTAWVHKLGASKYGIFNWRSTGVCASTYVHAIMRHLNAWRDGEDLDPESGISHLAHIACSCNIMMDANYCEKLQDDRNKVLKTNQ